MIIHALLNHLLSYATTTIYHNDGSIMLRVSHTVSANGESQAVEEILKPEGLPKCFLLLFKTAVKSILYLVKSYLWAMFESRVCAWKSASKRLLIFSSCPEVNLMNRLTALKGSAY